MSRLVVFSVVSAMMLFCITTQTILVTASRDEASSAADWTIELSVESGHIEVNAWDPYGKPIRNAATTLVARPADGEARTIALQLTEAGDYRADHDLSEGRWNFEVLVERDGHQGRLVTSRQL